MSQMRVIEEVAVRRRSSPAARLLSFASSIHLTLWLLGLLTFALVVGTLLPQNAPEETYLRLFGRLSGPFLARSTWTHLFTSWWFCTLFALLGLNLLACALSRGLHLLKTRPPSPAPYAPVLVHLGFVIVLAGAAWGHWPGHGYHRTVALEEGKVTPLEVAGERFGLRLTAAGSRTRRGRKSKRRIGRRSKWWGRERGRGSNQIIPCITTT